MRFGPKKAKSGVAMKKAIAREVEKARKLPESVPCETCGEQTTFTSTKRCNYCWEVETRLGDYLRRGGAKAIGVIVEAVISQRFRATDNEEG